VTWRALLRVVDFQELLTAQATFAEALGSAQESSGRDSEATRTLREGFNLLAKVLFTQRAAIRDVHDLAWLDHLVLAKGLGPAKTWHTERTREALDHLAGNRGRLGELIPGRHPTWIDVPLAGVGGLATLKAECGTSGALRAGVVAQESLLELVSELGAAAPRTKEGTAFLEDVHRLALAARRLGSESTALVLVSSVVD
jgi:hypothetical protein